jgi:hypothetical protein
LSHDEKTDLRPFLYMTLYYVTANETAND